MRDRVNFITPLITTIRLLLIFLVFTTVLHCKSRVVWAQTIQEREVEAIQLRRERLEQYERGQFKEALQTLKKILVIFREINYIQGEIEIIMDIGIVYYKMEKYSKSLDFYQQALTLSQNIYLSSKVNILAQIGLLYERLEEYSKAVVFFQKAISIYQPGIVMGRGAPSPYIGSTRLIDLESLENLEEYLGNTYLKIGDYSKAIDSFERYLDNLHYSNWVSSRPTLISLGNVYMALGDYAKAIDYFQQGLYLVREEGNRQGELEVLSVLGSARVLLGDATGLEYLQQSLTIAREISDKKNESQIFNDIGLVYKNLGELEKAIDSFQKALDLYTKLDEQIGQAEVIKNLGTTYASLGKYPKALEFFNRAYTFFAENNVRNGVATTLNNLGSIYRELGQFSRAREFYNRALLIHQDTGNLGGEASTLHNIGLAYHDNNRYEIALDFYQKSLDIWTNTGNLAGQATALNNIGLVQSELGQFEFALQSVEEAISIARSLNNRAKEGNILDSLGTVYRQAQQYDRALTAYEQALTILRTTENRATEQVTLANMGQLFEEQEQSELAIIFYKQSVNIIEEIRRDLRTLPREQQQSYTETVADTYRDLADLLLQNDRILEAQRVLDLLKVQELDDYLRNVRGNENTTQGLPNLPAEREAWNRYQAILNEAVEIGKERFQLEQKDTLTPDESQRLAELTNAQGQIRQDFNNFTRSEEVLALVAQRSPETLSQDLLLRMGDFNGLQDNLRNLEQNAVLLYPLILDDRLELILTTADSPPIRRTVAVSKQELNATIAAFRSALQNPTADAEPPARQLYSWLIQPIENDLKAANAETIIYGPDGQLRYIPLAALHDGENWLVQRYRINHITAYSLTDLDTEPQPQLNVLAGAFTTGNYSFNVGEQAFNFSGLPFAGVEVENLADTVPTTTKLIDTDFTPDVVPQFNRYNTIHLATHGAFVVGTPDESFIVFGNGERVTLRDIATWSLTNVDLVVLSACETGLGGNLGNGEEILGLGYQIQSAGARAAIASLWIVDDGGTQMLMNAFYGGLQQNLTKAEALRQAQIALITGDYSAVGDSRGNAIELVFAESLPPQVRQGLSHPYYWAPFILIGNGL